MGGFPLVRSFVLAMLAFTGTAAFAQIAAVAPTLIPVGGRLLTADGQPRTGEVLLVLSLYDGQTDPAPRWVEHQSVTLDATGGYSVQFGATLPEGLPSDLFTADGGTRWLGVGVQGEAEQPRVMLVSVPYAAKAASADSLGGKTASDFVLTSTFHEDLRTVLHEEGVTTESGDVSTEAITNSLQKSNGSGGLLDSTVFDVGENVGIGTSTPASQLHVSGFSPELRIDRPGGALGLFKALGTVDFGSLSSHDVRILANNSETMRVTGTGRVGIGTPSPASRLHIVDNTESEFRLQINGGALAMLRGVVGAADFGSFSNHPTRFFANSQQVMHLAPSGNVGIGSTVPMAKLHVGGNVAVDGTIASPTITSFASELAALTARVAKLEGQIVEADLAGTYRLSGFFHALNVDDGLASIDSAVLTGTVTIAAGGTGTVTQRFQPSQLAQGNPWVLTRSDDSDTVPLTWTFDSTAAVVTVTVSGDEPTQLGVAAGGRVWINTAHTEGLEQLIVLTRLR